MSKVVFFSFLQNGIKNEKLERFCFGVATIVFFCKAIECVQLAKTTMNKGGSLLFHRPK